MATLNICALEVGIIHKNSYICLMILLVENKIEAIKLLCREYDVKSMYVFGSASTGLFSEKSDIDILISFKDISIEKYTDNYFILHEKLEELFGRKVDLLTENSLSNPYFIESVEESKQLLYAA